MRSTTTTTLSIHALSQKRPKPHRLWAARGLAGAGEALHVGQAPAEERGQAAGGGDGAAAAVDRGRADQQARRQLARV